MDPSTIVTIAFLMAAGAALYSSVGHGGASAYLAIMALFSVAPEVMRPTALTLNLVGSVIVGAALGNWLGTERLRRARLLQALALVMTPTSSEIGDLHLLPAGAAGAQARRRTNGSVSTSILCAPES